ncbi:DMT family transporter [Cylindrospermopsis raciborskii]|uniref:DMT family transporter n=1 Tax=Cylindrospermopsis raciborskii TaxID=77022 RepID=UPI001143DDB5|nr:DMT family transporter [Cylindrospermopsis raciborskii]TPX28416.1 DMT family transporter [Cylindrospermopsis raciborskii GIHE 2018]
MRNLLEKLNQLSVSLSEGQLKFIALFKTFTKDFMGKSDSWTDAIAQTFAAGQGYISLGLLVLGIVAIGFAPIFITWSNNEISPEATTFNRLWISSVFFGTWNLISLIRRDKLTSAPSLINNLYTFPTWGLFFLVGIILAARQLFWAKSLTHTSVASSVAIIYALLPPLTAIGGWIFFRHRVKQQFVVGTIISITGAIAISFQDFSVSSNELQGDFFSLISAILLPFYLLLMEKLLTQFETKTLVFWYCTIGALTTLPILLVTGNTLFPLSWQGWFSVISLALICQVIGQGLIAYSLNSLPSSLVAVTMLLDPVISTVFAWLVLGEQVGFVKGIACLIVLIGIYLAMVGQYAPLNESPLT